MNPWKGLKGLPKEMWIIAFSVLINRMGTMVLPFLVIYMISKIGLKPGTAGFVVSIYGIGALISAPFVGKLSDKIGAFRLVKLSLFLSGIVLLLYPSFTSYTSILMITLIWAIVGEAIRPAVLSLISTVVPAGQRKTAFALNRLMINLGMSIGPVLAGFLILIDFSIIFYADAITSLFAVVFLLFFPVKDKPIQSPEQKRENKNNAGLKSPLKDLSYIYFLIGIIPASMVIFQHFGAMPVFLVEDLKLATSTVGMLFAVNTVLIIFVEVPLNTSMTGWHEKNALAVGALLLAVGFGLMAFAGSVISIALTIVIWTFGEMIFFPSTAAYVADIAPPEKRGEYMGYYQMVFSIAFTFGPWLGTKVFEVYGSFILWIGAYFTGLISACLLFYVKNKKSVKMD